MRASASSDFRTACRWNPKSRRCGEPECDHSYNVDQAGVSLNWLVLKGRLNRDKQRLLAQLDAAIAEPASAPLRPDWLRGL